MVWAAISPTPHMIAELMTWVLTGWIAKQFWYHFHNFNIFPKVCIYTREKEIPEKKKEWKKDRESDIKKETRIMGFGRSCPFGLSFWRRPEYSDAPLISSLILVLFPSAWNSVISSLSKKKKKIVSFLESVQMKRVISIVGRLTQNYRYLYL